MIRHGKRIGYGSIPIHTIFRGMNIHLPAILMFTKGDRVLTHPRMISQDRAVPLQTFERFDPELGRWEKLPRMPTARCHGRSRCHPGWGRWGGDGDAMGDSWGTWDFSRDHHFSIFGMAMMAMMAMGFHDRDSDPWRIAEWFFHCIIGV